MASESNWSDQKKWIMGILSALIVAAIIALANRSLSRDTPDPTPRPNPTPELSSGLEPSPTPELRPPQPSPEEAPSSPRDSSSVSGPRDIVTSPNQAQDALSSSEVTQTDPPAGSSVKHALWPSFETESYRLTVENMKKSGKTVRITMMLEAIDEGGLSFRAGEWYLLDENGERWNEVKRDPALVRHQRSGRDGGAMGAPPALMGVNLVSGTKIKDSLVFNATGSGQGARFTLVGLESRPQSEREIILRDLVTKE